MIFTQEAPLTRKWFSGRSCIRSNWNKLGVNFEEGGNRSARRKPSKSGWDRLKLNPHTSFFCSSGQQSCLSHFRHTRLVYSQFYRNIWLDFSHWRYFGSLKSIHLLCILISTHLLHILTAEIASILRPCFELVDYSLSSVGGLLVLTSLVWNAANWIFNSSNRSIWVCARFGQENGASEGETLEQPRDERSSWRNSQKPSRQVLNQFIFHQICRPRPY